MWEETSGMTGALAGTDRDRLTRGGLVPLTTEQGMTLLDTALEGPAGAALVAAKLNMAVLRAADAAQTSPLLRGLLPAPKRRTTTGPAEDRGPSLVRQLSDQQPHERRKTLLEAVTRHVADVLALDSRDRVDVERGFLQMGFDSLMAVELRNRLSRAVDQRLPSTVVFDHPTPNAMAEFLLQQVGLIEPSDHQPVLDEIDKAEASLSTITPEARANLARRLETFLQKLNEPESDASAAASPVTTDLKSATDDEVFDFIDNELGLS
ncbi:hypothetical protein DTL70_30710 [Streptomyces diacarni]|uniref:Carrier domain-containing protein n=1 Tax=Streptomyces diacarni TaxID=2800381 RepID=A0A367EDC6_9ACTN|nr:hypothetical protein DTL70_30710 [Streptomyces diacarni]